MHRWLLNHVHTSLLMFLYVFVAILVAYVMLRLVRRFLPSLASGEQDGIAVLSVEIIGAVYGILLGFVIVSLWEGFNAADENVGREATALSQIVRSAQAFDPAARDEVNRAVGEYAHAVVDDEWGLLRDGKTSERASQGISNVYSALQRYEPKTETQKTFYAASVEHLDEALAARRTRLGQGGGQPGRLAALHHVRRLRHDRGVHDRGGWWWERTRAHGDAARRHSDYRVQPRARDEPRLPVLRRRVGELGTVPSECSRTVLPVLAGDASHRVQGVSGPTVGIR